MGTVKLFKYTVYVFKSRHDDKDVKEYTQHNEIDSGVRDTDFVTDYYYYLIIFEPILVFYHSS